jgi:hypothetical protein
MFDKDLQVKKIDVHNIKFNSINTKFANLSVQIKKDVINVK